MDDIPQQDHIMQEDCIPEGWETIKQSRLGKDRKLPSRWDTFLKSWQPELPPECHLLVWTPSPMSHGATDLVIKKDLEDAE